MACYIASSPPRALDALIELDLQILRTNIRVLFSDLLHCLLLRRFYTFLHSVECLVELGALAARLERIPSCADIEMHVVILGNVFAADVAYYSSTVACHFVTSLYLDYTAFAFGTFSDEGHGAGFFDLMAFTKAIFFLELFATERYVGDQPAFAAADLFALGVATTELFVGFDGRADSREIAEWTGFQVGEVCFPKFRLLLKAFKLLYSTGIQEARSLHAAEDRLAATAIHAGERIAGHANLGCCILGGATEAE